MGLSYLITCHWRPWHRSSSSFVFVEFDHETSLSRKVRFHSVMCIGAEIKALRDIEEHARVLYEYLPERYWDKLCKPAVHHI